MQGNAKSIYSVFTENSRFVVPIYQRQYSWRIEQCKQLWNDIIACATNKRDKHFFGSTVRVPDAAGMIVIDGQQRITTISLLMLAIRNALLTGEKQATRGGSTPDWILNEFLLERCYPPKWMPSSSSSPMKTPGHTEHFWQKGHWFPETTFAAIMHFSKIAFRKWTFPLIPFSLAWKN